MYVEVVLEIQSICIMGIQTVIIFKFILCQYSCEDVMKQSYVFLGLWQGFSFG